MPTFLYDDTVFTDDLSDPIVFDDGEGNTRVISKGRLIIKDTTDPENPKFFNLTMVNGVLTPVELTS